MERGKEREEAWSFDGASDVKRAAAKESEENKENLLMNSELKDDLLLYQDEEALNDSIVSGECRADPGRGNFSPEAPRPRRGGASVASMWGGGGRDTLSVCEQGVSRRAQGTISQGPRELVLF